MPIQFHCPSCRKPIEVDEVYAAKEVGCPYCLKVVTTPATGTLTNPPVTARPLGEPPPVNQPAPFQWAQTAPPPSLRPSRLSVVGFALAMGSLLFIMAGAMVMNPVIEDYAQKKKLNFQDATTALQQDLLNRKSPPQVEMLFLGAALSCLGFLVNLGGLICSLIALFQPTGRKAWAIAGTVVGLIWPMWIVLGILTHFSG